MKRNYLQEEIYPMNSFKNLRKTKYNHRSRRKIEILKFVIKCKNYKFRKINLICLKDPTKAYRIKTFQM